MKIVLDLQGAQSHSRHRGIGRYSVAMARAFAAEASHHDVWLALNGRHDEVSMSLIAQFDGLIALDRVIINELPAGIAGCHPDNHRRGQIAAAAQAGFLAGLQADCIWHSSLFEGWGDDSTAALGTGSDDHRHVATLYDLIPLRNPARHLHDAAYRLWYYRRLGLMKRCGLLLAISESSRREAIDALQIRPEDVVVVSGAADAVFKPAPADAACWARWQQQWRLRPGFVLYAGGYDAHKNVDTLIAAYAQLSPGVRQAHPLVLAGRCDEFAAAQLRALGRRYRLPDDGLIFTGALSDSELARLYSSCGLFVAPSLHEGLGLPPLEAMACGAAVIGSDTSSLPEVIGRADALFDPLSRSSIAAKLHKVLTQPGLLTALRAHAIVQTRQFAWPVSARRALAAIEQRIDTGASPGQRAARARPRLIYVSPLPPARSGIADYSARLLRELASHYDIEVVVDQPEVVDPWVQANLPIRSLQWFVDHAHTCVRVLYHFGNSPFHAHMFGMLEQHPGVVVLHDSSLGAVRHWMAHESGDSGAFPRLLYDSHGHAALEADLRDGRAATLDRYAVNRDVIAQALGVLVHSRYAVAQARTHFGDAAAAKFSVVPFPRQRSQGDRRLARRLLGIAPDDFVVCSFGILAPTKLNHRLLAAWLQSSLAADASCRLIFVGENHGGDYGAHLSQAIHAAAARVQISGFVSTDVYDDYLAAADAVVQLRTDSRGETSAAVFDALAHGLPLLVNAHGTASELPPTAVLRIPDQFSDAELVAALEAWKSDDAERRALGKEAARLIEQAHHPADVALQYREAIERFVQCSPAAEEQRLRSALQRTSTVFNPGSAGWRELQQALVINRPRLDRRRLYVDVTSIAGSDLRSGIERVVRGVLAALLQLDQSDYRIEPVRLRHGCYRYATDYALALLGHPAVDLPQGEVQPQAGDILLGLDWVADALPANSSVLDALRVRGVRLLFVVYDLLPVRMPHWFPAAIAPMHARWLQCIGRYADGLLCISRCVADDLRDWFDAHPPQRRDALPLGYFYPGSDTAATNPTAGLPPDANSVLARLRKVPTFLMVGTVEPRKGHAFVLDAFEQLWAEGGAACLVVVGREGWMCAALASRLRGHPRAGAQLFWLEHISDEYLDRLQEVAWALLAASEAEGFGLPLVEAARRGLPVIARDIAVFREVSSPFARYFDGDDPASLVAALRSAAATDRPCPDGAAQLPQAPAGEAVLSWRDTTARLWRMLSDTQHPQWLKPWSPS